MYAHQETVIHNLLLLQKLTVFVHLPASKYLRTRLVHGVQISLISFWCLGHSQNTIKKIGIICSHLRNSSNHCFCNRKIKLRSRSFRVVYSSISACGLSVVRPRDDPFRSNRLWIVWSEQNRFPIMTKRTWVVAQHQADNQDRYYAWQRQIHK